MGMVVIGSKTRWGGKEVVEGGEVDKDRKDKTGWRWWGGGSNYGDRDFNDRRRDVLNWDVFN